MLVGHPDGVKPALVRDVPPAVTEVVNSKPVALGPISVNFANIVETRGVIVRRLELLRLEQLVCVRKLQLPYSLLGRSFPKTRHIGDLATITCKDGHAAGAGHAHRGNSVHLLEGHRSGSWLSSNHDRLLTDEGLWDDGRLLSNNVAWLGDWDAGNSRLLETKLLAGPTDKR